MTPTGHAERREAGSALRSQLWGNDEATDEDLSGAETPGAIRAWQTDYVLGEIWSRPVLSLRDRSLASLAAAAVTGHAKTTEKYAAAALHVGVSVEDLDSVVAQLFAYGGEPCGDVANEAIASVAEREGVPWPLRDEPGAKDDDQRTDDGYDVMRTLGGGRVPPTAELGLEWFSSNLHELGPYAYRWAFGDVWCHGPLSRRDRSLLAIAITGTAGTAPQLRTHAGGGINHGLSREGVEEILLSVSTVIGIPRAFSALLVVWELWATLDGAAP